MGVTVEAQAVYRYPFEQVVASYLRKVKRGHSRRGLETRWPRRRNREGKGERMYLDS